jgi:AcrR family transcriptional regulator
VPRAGLSRDEVVAAAADLADDVGIAGLTMGLLAERLGVRTQSLYTHVANLADLRHRLATRTMTEFGDVIGDAVKGRSGLDALTAMLTASRRYALTHPGRYAIAVDEGYQGPADPMLAAGSRVADTIAAVLSGYGIGKAEMHHAIRAIRSAMDGFTMLERGKGFQWDPPPEESFGWMIGFLDRGLRATCGHVAAG